MWQYTSGGSVDGIEGKVDFNLSYLKIENSVPDVVQEEEEEETQIDPADIPEEEIEEPRPIGGTENADF
jgi:GH25 family lysozyme M1 (1,4-beta-N-acetylmuramidase)